MPTYNAVRKQKKCVKCNELKDCNAFVNGGDSCRKCNAEKYEFECVTCKQVKPMSKMRSSDMCSSCFYYLRLKGKLKETKHTIFDYEKAKIIIRQYIRAWESPAGKSKAEFECIYIDFCKLLGVERKRNK